MATTNSSVVYSWSQGSRAAAGNLSTDGEDLYSYNLCIGYTTPQGNKVVLNYTAAGEYQSQTTSCHVGLVRRGADEVMHPATYRAMEIL